MVEQLFGSKTRVKLLQLFYSNPNRSFYVREITRKIDEQINSVRRELSNLLSIGIITSETTNNRLYYEVNQKYEYHKPLREIFGGPQSSSDGTQQTGDAGDGISDELKSLGHLELLLYTGQFTRDDRSGVDLLIVGDINPTQLTNYITDLEKQEGRAIRYAAMNHKEFIYRKQINDRFIYKVLESKNQIIYDRGLISEPVVEEEPAKAPAKSVKKG